MRGSGNVFRRPRFERRDESERQILTRFIFENANRLTPQEIEVSSRMHGRLRQEERDNINNEPTRRRELIDEQLPPDLANIVEDFGGDGNVSGKKEKGRYKPRVFKYI